MRRFFLTGALLAPLALAACAVPIGPVEVTRFHAPEKIALLGKGSIAVEAGPGMDADSLELASYRAAVGRELVKLGYNEVGPGEGSQVAEVRLRRAVLQAERSGSPVNVGVGGSTGSYGSNVGVGVGIDLSGPPPEQVLTELLLIGSLLALRLSM